MKSMVQTISILLMASLFFIKPCQAQESQAGGSSDNIEIHSAKNALSFNIGLFSAVGLYGITYNRNFSEHFELEFGAGNGLSGLQLSLMPKLSFGTKKHRFVTGLGLALGIDKDEKISKISNTDTTTSLWLNLDLVGYELRTTPSKGASFFLLVSGGLTLGLYGHYLFENDLFSGVADIHGNDDDSDNATLDSCVGAWGPQVRVALGVSF